jgi:riboflavin biosynthesis pyrimidine reductase
MKAEAPLAPLEPLFDRSGGTPVTLPPELARLYEPLRFAADPTRAHVISNFVSSLDGVVSLGRPGTGGRDISGNSREDRGLMGLLRAVADVVIVGAGTLRAFPRHVWTPEAIYAPLSAEYATVRERLGKSRAPVCAVVTASGDVDPTLPVFTSGRAPAIVVTTAGGAKGLGARGAGALDVRVAADAPSLEATQILRALQVEAGQIVLLECGPHLMADFLAARAVDELFLTLAPQIAGRKEGSRREGFVAGALFLPDRPIWGDLVSVRRCGNVLFFRYQIPTQE